MSDYTFRDWVRDEYGPFAFNEDLDDFILQRDEELHEAYDTWSRDCDE